MSIFPWIEDLPDAREFPASCRGCSKPIRLLSTEGELWEDAAGLTTCVKARLADIGAGQRPDYVLHQPMPAGLVGAPAGG
jgi:hypothetical protein